jgi:hypothetical protein
MWWRVTFRGPELSQAACDALDTEDIGLVHGRHLAHDREHHVALIFADAAEAAIDVMIDALDPHGAYSFFEVWPFPPSDGALSFER